MYLLYFLFFITIISCNKASNYPVFSGANNGQQATSEQEIREKNTKIALDRYSKLSEISFDRNKSLII